MLGVESGGVGRRVEGGLAFEEDLLTEAKGKGAKWEKVVSVHHTPRHGKPSRFCTSSLSCPVLSCPA